MSVSYDITGTLRAQEHGHPPLIYDARGNGGGEISPTITGDHQNRITDYTAIVVENERILGNGDRPGECRNHAGGGCPTLNTTAEQPILFEVETHEDTDVPCKHSTECGTN